MSAACSLILLIVFCMGRLKGATVLYITAIMYLDTATFEVALPMKGAWSFLGCSQQILIMAHILNCSVGSYYHTISVE